MIVFTLNIALVIVGMAIPLGTVIFWSKSAKILNRRFENKSCGATILDCNTVYNLVKWLYSHRSKFNILMAAIVTIIEFLALIPF
jgi:hypothetical protein